MHTTTQPNHTQIAIQAIRRIYRETNTLADARRIPIDVAAQRLLAYADLLALLEPHRQKQGASRSLMLEALEDWEDQTYETRALVPGYQQKAERAAITWIKKTYFSL